MSTRLYLVCLSHDPPIASQSEVGYQLRHLPAVRGYVADRSVLAAAVEAGAEEFGDQFRTTAAWFLWRHPGCRIGIRDELDEDHSLTDEAFRVCPPPAEDGGPSGEAVEAAGLFMAAMAEEERTRSSLPPVVSAVEWERASDGGG